MIFHFFLMPILMVVVIAAIAMRVLTFPFRMGHWHRHRRHGWYRNRYGWDGYRNPYAPGLLTILAIVAMERLFGRRYY